MNDISFPYVVLRNFENLPYDVKLGEHSDLDLLVYDIDHWQEIYPEAERVYPSPRVQFKQPVGDSYIQIDVRYIGDGYYPSHFEKLLLDTREYNHNGFYIPAKPLHDMALAYHAVHHKNSNQYKNYLGDATVEELLSALKESDIGWIEPEDPTVGKYNSYLKGATAVVSKKSDSVIKKQYNYMERDLIANEIRVLSRCGSSHFPKVINSGKDNIELEDCEQDLNVDNLPEDWKKQFVEIIDDLRKHNIQHRDIRPENLMVKDGVIKLIDFGWARFEDDPDDNPPSCLGKPYKASYGFDDNFSLSKIMREYRWAKEIGAGR